jgi:hypothetical protein
MENLSVSSYMIGRSLQHPFQIDSGLRPRVISEPNHASLPDPTKERSNRIAYGIVFYAHNRRALVIRPTIIQTPLQPSINLNLKPAQMPAHVQVTPKSPTQNITTIHSFQQNFPSREKNLSGSKHLSLNIPRAGSHKYRYLCIFTNKNICVI